MSLQYKVVALPRVWPGEVTKNRTRSKFKSMWTKTEGLLERELAHLGGRDVALAIDIDARWLREDGKLRADARPGPAVILTFRNGKGERFEFPCDTFGWWQDNVYAIALAMEALRKVDRYGVRAGRQYEGFKALPASATEHVMTEDEAAGIIAEFSGFMPETVMLDVKVFDVALKVARSKAHPDAGGKADDFQRLEKARAILDKYFEAERALNSHNDGGTDNG